MNGEVLLQEIERIHRERDVDKEVIFQGLESALASAFRKKFENSDIAIDRKTGEIRALSETGEPIPTETLGRIAAQTAKQVLIQKIREAERNVIYDEFEKYKGDIVHGIIQRYEGSNVILNLNKTEGFLPKREQVRDENYTLGARMRAYVLDVEKRGHKVLTLLSRTYPDFVRRLFELEIPEIAERTIEIKGLVREAGYRTKIAVASFDSKVDCVGACVGVRGSRIKNIIEELQGEKIDIIRWSDNTEEMIRNALKPAEISEIKLDWEHFKASVYVETEQLSLAIGKRGQNVRLAAKLCGWDIDIISIPQKGEPPQVFHASSELSAEKREQMAKDPLAHLFKTSSEEESSQDKEKKIDQDHEENNHEKTLLSSDLLKTNNKDEDEDEDDYEDEDEDEDEDDYEDEDEDEDDYDDEDEDEDE